jgi:membrane-associated progesterone receptor component
MIRFLLLLLCISKVQGFVLSPAVPTKRTQITQVHLSPEVIVGLAVVVTGGAAVVWFGGSEERAKQAKYAEWEQIDQARQEERARLAYIAPREEQWTEQELKPYDGNLDPDGPILFAAAGKVYNVWKGRHFYGPGCEYAMFAGRDATRLLAKFRTEEEDAQSLAKPLTMAERATLEGYIWTFNKYEVVGTLAGYDPKDTVMW